MKWKAPLQLKHNPNRYLQGLNTALESRVWEIRTNAPCLCHRHNNQAGSKTNTRLSRISSSSTKHSPLPLPLSNTHTTHSHLYHTLPQTHIPLHSKLSHTHSHNSPLQFPWDLPTYALTGQSVHNPSERNRSRKMGSLRSRSGCQLSKVQGKWRGEAGTLNAATHWGSFTAKKEELRHIRRRVQYTPCIILWP